MCLVGREAVGFPARPARPGPRHSDLLQDGLEPGAVRLLPRVTTGDSRWQRPSALGWSWVVDPPREQPRPLPPAPPPPGGRRGSATASRPGAVRCRRVPPCPGNRRRVDAGTGRTLMRPHDRGGDRDVPVDLPDRVGLGLDLLEQTLRGSVVDHLPVIPPPATTPVAGRQDGPQPFSLGITQITLTHARINDPGARQSHDRPDRSWSSTSVTVIWMRLMPSSRKVVGSWATTWTASCSEAVRARSGVMWSSWSRTVQVAATSVDEDGAAACDGQAEMGVVDDAATVVVAEDRVVEGREETGRGPGCEGAAGVRRAGRGDRGRVRRGRRRACHGRLRRRREVRRGRTGLGGLRWLRARRRRGSGAPAAARPDRCHRRGAG